MAKCARRPKRPCDAAGPLQAKLDAVQLTTRLLPGSAAILAASVEIAALSMPAGSRRSQVQLYELLSESFGRPGAAGKKITFHGV